jgi:nanoRNase/pAp phosphatase (c-di-AMP/oligoRNAs hydrolase)
MSRVAPSCARVIYDFLGGSARFPAHWNPMMAAVDKVDSADLTREEIESPTGWVLIGYIMDPRTGLGRFRQFRIANYQLMMEMIEYCRTMTADEILRQPDVRERADLYFEQDVLFRDMLKRCSRQVGEVVVIDFRQEETIYAGNRFLVYTLFPECKVSIHVTWGKERQNVPLAMGNSILNRTNRANLGSIALHFGGGGHESVATCQVATGEVDGVLDAIIKYIHEANAAG